MLHIDNAAVYEDNRLGFFLGVGYSTDIYSLV